MPKPALSDSMKKRLAREEQERAIAHAMEAYTVEMA
jgi:hypothetical protein